MVTSRYGVGCTLAFTTLVTYSTREGHFNLTWSVFNNNTKVNSSEPIPYSGKIYVAALYKPFSHDWFLYASLLFFLTNLEFFIWMVVLHTC